MNNPAPIKALRQLIDSHTWQGLGLCLVNRALTPELVVHHHLAMQRMPQIYLESLQA